MQYLTEGETLSTVFKAQLKADWRIKKLYEFMQISPTYLLAHKLRNNQLSDDALVPNDFDTVLQVYDDLGEVWATGVEQWWLKGAQKFFVPVVKPQPHLVTRLEEQSIRDLSQVDVDHVRAFNDTYNDLGDYWVKPYANQLFPDCAVIAVPLRGDATSMKSQVNKLIDKQFNSVNHPPHRAKYSFNNGSRTRETTLEKYLFIVKYKALDPDISDADLGDILTQKYGYQKVASASQVQTKRNLESQTSGDIKKARWVAEWAARLRFVHIKATAHTILSGSLAGEKYKPQFDYAFIGECLRDGRISLK